MSISIKGLNKAAVLAALFNASKPQGLGFVKYNPKPMTVEEAEVLLKQTTDFDYLQGRIMKINLAEDELDTRWYNRDNGKNAAEKVIAILRQGGGPDAQPIRDTHGKNTLAAANDVEKRLDDMVTISGNAMRLGLSDVKHVLGPAVAKVTRHRN
jgi:hypothetical protein